MAYVQLPNQNRLTGINTLAYMGTEASTPPQFVIEKRDPTQNDYKLWMIGTMWLTQGTENVWILIDKTNNVATWLNMTDVGSDFVTDNGTANPVDQTINVLGGTNMHTEALAPTGDTITINTVDHPDFSGGLTVSALSAPGIVMTDAVGLFNSTNGTDRQIIVARAGGPVWVDLFSSDGTVIISDSVDPLHPDGINLQVVGGGGGGSVAGLKADDFNTATPDPVTGLINVNGTDLIYTSAVPGTLTIDLEDSTDAGDVIIGGGAGVDSTWGKLVSGGSTVAITYIPGGTDPLILYPRINFEAAGGGGGIVELDGDAGVAVPAAGKVKVLGGGGLTTSGAGDTLTISSGAPSGAGAKGMIMIGSSAGNPVWNTLTGAGGITITNSDGGITITGGGGSGSYGIATFDLDNSVAIDTGTHILKLEGHVGTTNVNHTTYPYKNIWTTSPDPASNTVYLSLASTIQLPLTNAGGTAGMIMLGTSDFMHAYGTRNTFLGSNAGNRSMTTAYTADNTGIGYEALRDISGASPTTNYSHYNTAVGSGAMRYAGQGVNANVAIGYRANYSLSTGDSNVAIGTSSMFNGPSGSYNIGIGSATLYDITTAGSNVAIGYVSSTNITTGSRNTTVGGRSGYTMTTGEDSVALGYQSLYLATTAAKSVAVGYESLKNITTGSSNVALGYAAGNAYATETGNLSIASHGVPGETNTIRIGDTVNINNPYNHQAFYAQGIYNKTIGATNHLVGIDNTGKLGKVNNVVLSVYPANDLYSLTGDLTKYYFGVNSPSGIDGRIVSLVNTGGGTLNVGGGVTEASYTVPLTGIYQLYMTLRFNGLTPPVPPYVPPVITSTDPMAIEIWRGGAVWETLAYYPVLYWNGYQDHQSFSFTITDNLQAGDILKWYIQLDYRPTADKTTAGRRKRIGIDTFTGTFRFSSFGLNLLTI